MLHLLLVSVFLLAATVAIHGFGTHYWIRYLMHRFAGPDGNFKVILPGDQLNTFEEATYFAIVTFTTLGFGDITLAEHVWRLVSGIEALNGILLVGWTTALLFLVFQRSWEIRAHGRGE